MAKYIIDGDTLTRLADALRDVTGKEQKFTPDEMIDEVTHVLESATYILVDENGTEVPAVLVGNEVVLTATPNDIRLGTTAVTGDGVTEGEKEIPSYRAVEGCAYVRAGATLTVSLFSDMCEYTVLQSIVCAYNTDVYDSVSADKVVIDGSVYNVKSTEVLSKVSVDKTLQTIELGLTNTSPIPAVIRYMIIKEDAQND